MDEEATLGMLKAVAWHQAKAALRTVAELEGHRRIVMGRRLTSIEEGRYETVNDVVEKFIGNFENEAYQE